MIFYIYEALEYVYNYIKENGFATFERRFLLLLSVVMLISAIITLIAMIVYKMRASYGRYTEESMFGNYAIDARLGWFLQEVPSFLIPLCALLRSYELSERWFGVSCALLFILHYFQRFVYASLIRGGKKSIPFHLFALGFIFTTWNGYIQGHYHVLYADYSFSSFTNTIRYVGFALFWIGAFVNIHSDHILRNLRSDSNDKSYKIPRGMFEYVSGANFFGEILEWFGYSLYCQTLTSFAFALFTFCNTMPRAVEHHSWYQKKFEDYPKDRKAVFIDMSFDSMMSKKEKSRLVNQLCRVYSLQKKYDGLKTTICAPSNHILEECREKIVGFDNFDWTIVPLAVDELLINEQSIVLLSPDAENPPLETIDEYKCYVIGGLVDETGSGPQTKARNAFCREFRNQHTCKLLLVDYESDPTGPYSIVVCCCIEGTDCPSVSPTNPQFGMLVSSFLNPE
ncbi:3-oxo-5-alpha-steroid 4-dehydrogenase [Aphelenchoides besseyi]|nr:3-oxo-5-alpha-steroid 4-dehydrogenase [Aphelenchoides besseyi]